MSKEVKRWDWHTGCGCMIEDSDGSWVESADYDALLAERDGLREDRDSQQRVCIAEMEKVTQLRAEVEAMKKDAERLDRLDIECEAYGCEGIHEGNRWMIDGPFRTVRDAIDAALQGEQP